MGKIHPVGVSIHTLLVHTPTFATKHPLKPFSTRPVNAPSHSLYNPPSHLSLPTAPFLNPFITPPSQPAYPTPPPPPPTPLLSQDILQGLKNVLLPKDKDKNNKKKTALALALSGPGRKLANDLMEYEGVLEDNQRALQGREMYPYRSVLRLKCYGTTVIPTLT